MTPLQLILILELSAVASAGAGAFLAFSLKKINHHTLCFLISLAAGALLAVSTLDIIPEVVTQVGLGGTLVSVLSGYFLFYLITRHIAHICPACAATHTEVNFKAITWGLVIALGIHSFLDGVAVFCGQASHAAIGLPVFLAVVFHKLPEGMALTLVGRASGFSRAKAFFIALTLEGVTTLAGGWAGFAAGLSHFPTPLAYVIGHVAGGFIFLVIHALLGEALKSHPRSTVLAAALGFMAVALIQFI